MNLRLLALAGAFALVAGCGSVAATDEPNAGSDPTPTRTPPPMPTKIPDADGLVRSLGMPTVLGRVGEAPQLCLGAVAESLPPQCGGPVISGWDWSDYEGHFDETAGVRWGSYQVSGRLEDGKFALRHAWVNNKWGLTAGGSMPAPGAPCPAPDGGWRPVDDSEVDDDAMNATFEAAQGLPGYADSRLSRMRNNAIGSGDAAWVQVVSVRVTEDLEGAEATLRETWSGALCVARATYSLVELQGIQERVNDLPGMLTSGADGDTVEVNVVYDDGSLQAWADEAYGPGVVEISSALVPESD